MECVEHLLEEKRFVLNCEGSQAVLHYTLLENNLGAPRTINFTSTFVPPECRGKGIAEKLVRTGIAWAKAQGYELQASCWYVAKFLC